MTNNAFLLKIKLKAEDVKETHGFSKEDVPRATRVHSATAGVGHRQAAPGLGLNHHLAFLLALSCQ